jgi:molybdopterin converting factor small subunit
MPTVTVRIPTPLRGFTAEADEVTVDAADVGGAIHVLNAAHPGIAARILTPEGELRPYVNLFVGTHNVRDLDGLASALREGDVIAIIPAVAGGAR